MLVTRTSLLSKKEHTLEVDVTEAQLQAYRDGALIQDACPHLPDDLREFLITGITPEEWKAHFGDEEES